MYCLALVKPYLATICNSRGGGSVSPKQCTVWVQCSVAIYWLELPGVTPVISRAQLLIVFVACRHYCVVPTLKRAFNSEYRDMYLVY